MEKIQALTRKGDKYFKFKDTHDFNSYFTEAQRIQRQQNRTFFQSKFGNSQMAHRCIASQSQYNPKLLNQFRLRNKQKEIQPSMKYSHRNQCSQNFSFRRFKSMMQKTKAVQKDPHQQHETADFQQAGRRITSVSSISFLGGEDDARSTHTVHTIKTQSDSSYINHKLSINLKKPNRKKQFIKQTKQLSKSYFIGILDIKQHTKDPHVKKSLHNILVKVGKNKLNSKEKELPVTIEALNSQIFD